MGKECYFTNLAEYFNMLEEITPKSSAEQSIQGIIVLKIYNFLVDLRSELGVVHSEANKSYVTFCYFVYYTLSFVSI